jgi:hypothetical protein
LNVVADAKVIRVIPLVHVHGHNAVLLSREFDDLVSLGDIKAHWLFCDDMCARGERGENRLRVQIVRCSHGHDVEVGDVAENVFPGRIAEILFRRVTSPFLERCRRARRGCLRTRSYSHQFKFHRGKIARISVEPKSRELSRNTEPLQVGVGAQMDVPAEHSGPYQCDFDGSFHDKTECRPSRVLAPSSSGATNFHDSELWTPDSGLSVNPGLLSRKRRLFSTLPNFGKTTFNRQ